MLLISGIIVATNGMLSKIAERNAEDHKMTAPAVAMRAPVSPTTLPASRPSTPLASTA